MKTNHEFALGTVAAALLLGLGGCSSMSSQDKVRYCYQGKANDSQRDPAERAEQGRPGACDCEGEMKTTTILDAFVKANEALWINTRNSQRQYDTFRAALLRRIEQGDRARDALKDVEWVEGDDDVTEDKKWCPWCGNWKRYGKHSSYCKRQLALGIKP